MYHTVWQWHIFIRFRTIMYIYYATFLPIVHFMYRTYIKSITKNGDQMWKLWKIHLFSCSFKYVFSFGLKMLFLTSQTKRHKWMSNLELVTYSWFHIKGTFSVHSFNEDYLSIHECPGSWGYLFHEIPCTSMMSKRRDKFFSRFSPQ